MKEQRHYQVRVFQGQPLTRTQAGQIVRECFRVPEEVRRLRRHRHRPTKKSIRQEAVHAEMERWGIQRHTRQQILLSEVSQSQHTPK